MTDHVPAADCECSFCIRMVEAYKLGKFKHYLYAAQEDQEVGEPNTHYIPWPPGLSGPIPYPGAKATVFTLPRSKPGDERPELTFAKCKVKSKIRIGKIDTDGTVNLICRLCGKERVEK